MTVAPATVLRGLALLTLVVAWAVLAHLGSGHFVRWLAM